MKKPNNDLPFIEKWTIGYNSDRKFQIILDWNDGNQTYIDNGSRILFIFENKKLLKKYGDEIIVAMENSKFPFKYWDNLSGGGFITTSLDDSIPTIVEFTSNISDIHIHTNTKYDVIYIHGRETLLHHCYEKLKPNGLIKLCETNEYRCRRNQYD